MVYGPAAIVPILGLPDGCFIPDAPIVGLQPQERSVSIWSQQARPMVTSAPCVNSFSTDEASGASDWLRRRSVS